MTSEKTLKQHLEEQTREIGRLADTNTKLVLLLQEQTHKIEDQTHKIEQQSLKIEQQSQKLVELTQNNQQLSETVKELRLEIAKKDERIAALEQMKNKNSSNSDKPSSSDFFKKTKPSSINKGRQGSKKKNGGQKGHAGSTMELKEVPDVILQCLPSECLRCPSSHLCATNSVKLDSRNLVEVKVTTEQRRYDRIQRLCPESGKLLTGTYPDEVPAYMQYGPVFKSFVVGLSSFGMVSFKRITDILSGMFGISPSEGTISNIINDCAARCEEQAIPSIIKHILNDEVGHFDETGTRVEGVINWAHTAATEKATYIVNHKRRGVEGVLNAGILKGFGGVAVHDCWPTYYHQEFASVTHAVCGAHIDRELTAVIENHNQKWARSMKNLLKKIYETKEKLLGQGHSIASEKLRKEFFDRYDQILEAGFRRNPIIEPKKRNRGRPKRGKVRSLIERLRDYKEDVLRFFTNFRVPFSNNIAERSFRLSKLKTKVAGTFRSTQGAESFCTIFSVIDTVRKNEGNPIEALASLFTNSFSLQFT